VEKGSADLRDCCCFLLFLEMISARHFHDAWFMTRPTSSHYLVVAFKLRTRSFHYLRRSPSFVYTHFNIMQLQVDTITIITRFLFSNKKPSYCLIFCILYVIGYFVQHFDADGFRLRSNYIYIYIYRIGALNI
jgi:hypothetical protein